MTFETEQDVVHWFESEERVITPEFLASIPWHEVKNHSFKQEFVPVLLYMRDIERFTSMYYEELMQTPTGKNPSVKQFLDRWSTEEPLHGELLNRFLNEAGHETPTNWFEQAKANLTLGYRIKSFLQPLITNLMGRHFSSVHMTWGSIHELSTLSGYERLWRIAEHPVLEHILRAIVREEARHALFYWSVARIQLEQSKFRQQLSRFMVEHFWEPVGQGEKPASYTNLVISTLFKGQEGFDIIQQRINRRVSELPGFAGFTKVNDRLGPVVLNAAV